MPSTRSKLVLDEESFQGLLAAAFTIQQYNDKEGGIDAALSAELTGSVAPKGPIGKNGTAVKEDRDNGTAANVQTRIAASPELCPACATPLPASGMPCPTCDAEAFRPGERLQRTWATMWSLSQEQGTFTGSPPLPGQSGLEPNPMAANIASPTAETAARLPVAEEVVEDGDHGDGHLVLPIQAIAKPDVVNGGVATADNSPGPRVKVRFHRADLYLGLAVFIAFVALLWPSSSANRSELTPWERVLVAVGVAEEPSQAEVHYSGDPNIKVWVDTQAALYYCPGDELYGKSRGGYYSTQHEAQLDHFEPAFRRACVP